MLDAAVRDRATTLDRLLVVGIMRGLATWNADHGAPQDHMEAYWAVNLRPPRLFRSMVANHFAWSRIRGPGVPDAIAWADAMLDPANDALRAGALDWVRFVDAFHRTALPRPVRSALMQAVKRTAPAIAISNTVPLGDVGLGPLASAAGVRDVLFHSRYFVTDRPTLIVARSEGHLRLRLVYPETLFDGSGAGLFLQTCASGIVSLGVRNRPNANGVDAGTKA